MSLMDCWQVSHSSLCTIHQLSTIQKLSLEKHRSNNLIISISLSHTHTLTNKRIQTSNNRILRSTNITTTMKSLALSFALLAFSASLQLSAAQECLTVDTVQDLDLDAFISKPWYGMYSYVVVIRFHFCETTRP